MAACGLLRYAASAMRLKLALVGPEGKFGKPIGGSLGN
jgi:hypothetical protein